MSEEAPEIAPRSDPAKFALRAAAPRPVRVRRGVLIGLSACAVALISGTVMIALRAPAPRIAMEDDGRPADPSAAKEALAAAPAGYANVPVLGPPLTGREALTGKAVAPAPANADGGAAPGAEAAGERGPPGTAEVNIGKSPIMVSLGSRAAAIADADADADAVPPAPIASTVPDPTPSNYGVVGSQDVSTASDPNQQTHKMTFLRTSDSNEGVNPHVLTPAASRWIVSAGSIIAASLITGLNSDLPGEVTAQVTENVYDSPTGKALLIPQGSRLIGASDNGVSYGQKRALIVWRRLILPDGSSIALDNWPAADKTGATGLTDKVDGHSWQLIKGVALSTLLGIGSELSYGSSDSDLARALRQSVETGSNRAGQQLVSKSLDIQPTIRVRPGWPVRVVVHQDLLLQPWRPQSGRDQ